MHDGVLLNNIKLPFKGTPFDENGLLYFIGSQGGTANYLNPHKLEVKYEGKGVVASMSSMDRGAYDCSPFKFVDCVEHVNFSENLQPSWMQVDIGACRLMTVNHYCLRHGNKDSSTHALRNWEFQASNTGGNADDDWVTLRCHSNDCSLTETPFSVADWVVEETQLSNVGYRYFRIFNYGVNSSADYRLFCSGIELFGSFQVRKFLL